MRFKIKILVFLLISVNKLFGQNFNNYNTEINNCIRKADSCKVKLDYTNSFNYLSKALNQAKKTKNINAEVYCNIKLIELFRHASIFKKSEFYLTKTETLISKNKDKITDFNLMSFYSRKAALYSEYYNIADSVNYYSTKTLTLAKKLQNLDFQFISLMEIGFYYEQTNSLGNAIAYYEKGLQVAKQHNKTSEYCDALINLARTLEKTKYYNLAIDKCNEGLKILETSDNYFQKLLFYEIKQKAYLNLGNKSAAYDNLKQRLKYTDKYYENSIQIKLIEESKKYDLLERDKTISQKEKDIKTAK
ncbi:hypothetical protein P3875_03445 [Myroides sp. JBRI-B21084]|uniref:hypothetical protein n=1 Tax=Myroides sp. JBRI-B21084 TaxID=3119977 RepID=UPI0026E355B0|nr:hypothetical protein [Paenimyroides cloacae]WKW47126.1 hypothetical protein P3875_03445 [Paenimyroides cloacae]